MIPRLHCRTHAKSACLPVILGLLLVVGVGTAPGIASEPIGIVRIEEDWELVVTTPDANSTAPQVSCAISPLSHVNGLYAAFELNHQSQPEFTAGGLQLQVWNGEQPLSSRKFPTPGVLSSNNEEVRWTQTLALDGNTLTFEISNGNSTTWGTFGGQGYLRATVTTNLENLNEYDPVVSAQNSGVAYAGNRVAILVLKRVRATLSTGEVIEDTTERVVHAHN